jgi:hypothetical protein
MTSADFLNLACRWAFEHGTKFIQENEFPPSIRSMGVSDEKILRFRRDLEQRGFLTNLEVIGGWNGFTLTDSVFHRYVRSVIPKSVIQRAAALCASRMRSPGEPLTATYLAEQLGVPELNAQYILELLAE